MCSFDDDDVVFADLFDFDVVLEGRDAADGRVDASCDVDASVSASSSMMTPLVRLLLKLLALPVSDVALLSGTFLLLVSISGIFRRFVSASNRAATAAALNLRVHQRRS